VEFNDYQNAYDLTLACIDQHICVCIFVSRTEMKMEVSTRKNANSGPPTLNQKITYKLLESEWNTPRIFSANPHIQALGAS